jgi:TIR domain
MDVSFSRVVWFTLGPVIFGASALAYAAQQTWIIDDHSQAYGYSIYGVLLAGTMQLCFFGKFILFAALSPSDAWYQRIPFFSTGHPRGDQTRYAQSLFFLLFVLIPVVLTPVHLAKFLHGTAFQRNGDTRVRAQHFDYIGLQDSYSSHREWHYGCEECSKTYIPFWQPLAFVVHSGAVTLLGMSLILNVFVSRRRNPFAQLIWDRQMRVIARAVSLPEPPGESEIPRERGKVSGPSFDYDVFISYARSDSSCLAQELAGRLTDKGHRVWLDVRIVSLGVSLPETLGFGLTNSRRAVVIVSEAFLKQKWTRMELEFLTCMHRSAPGVILPVWHGVSEELVASYNTGLEGIVRVDASIGTEKVADRIAQILDEPSSSPDRVEGGSS